MRIRTQFIITTVVLGVILAVTGTSIVTTLQLMAHLDSEEDLAADIGRGAGELSYLSGDYLLYGEPQQRERWLAKWESVSADVARLSPGTPEERTIRDGITADLARVKSVFEDASRSAAAAPPTDGTPASHAAFQISWSRLAVQNQGIAFEALRLSQILRDQKALVNQRNVVLVAVMQGLFAVFFVVNYFTIYRRALRGMAQLRAGTKIVGSGDLDFVIPASRHDEVGELTRAFNRMTLDLKGVTASRTQLEHEVAERELAETSLLASLQEVELLSDQRERELETTKMLLEAADALAEWTDLTHLLENLADIVLESTVHKRVTLQMWDDTRRLLQTVLVRGDSESYPTPDILTWDQLSAPAQAAIEAQNAVVIDYEALPEQSQGAVVQIGARLALAVPLVYRQRLVGLVRVDDPGERREFDEREIALIQGLAAQAAVAIENGRLYEDERRVADALRAIFQRPVPVIDGIELDVVGHFASEAEKVGGDFYDAFAIGAEVAILVGDVAGKGLKAVGLTEQVRSAVRALAYAGKSLSPSYLLGRVNESLLRQLAPGEFVTAVLLTIDPSTGAYRLARAGHPLPVACGEVCHQIETPGGPPLGVAEGAYEETTGVLAADETIVMYTDGVTEARRDGQFYGDERLLESLSRQGLSPTGIVQGLYTDVEEFARGRLADDLLVVAVRLQR